MPVAKKKRKKVSLFRRLVAGMLWVSLCLLGLVGGVMLGFINSDSYIGVILRNTPTIINPDPAAKFGSDSVTFLVLGTDVDYNNRNQVIKGQARSDTMFLVRCDFTPNANRVDAISIPRDTMVRIPGHGRRKINSAHAHGGPGLARQTVEEQLDVKIDHVLVLDFVGFQKLIDAIGGLTINVEKKMDYDDNWGNLHIHLKPGLQTLTGYQAMGYVRYRHSDDDFHRMKRQQNFANAFKQQLKQQPLAKIPNVLQRVRDSIGGTVTNDDQLISLAAWVRTLDTNQIHMATLPVLPLDRFNFTIDREKAQALLEERRFTTGFSASNGDDSFTDQRAGL